MAVLAELMACAASLDKVKEFSSYAMEGFNSGDTVVVIGSGPLGLLHIAKADMMGAGQIMASDLSPYRPAWARRYGPARRPAGALRRPLSVRGDGHSRVRIGPGCGRTAYQHEPGKHEGGRRARTRAGHLMVRSIGHC